MRANSNSIFACYRYTWGKRLGNPKSLEAAVVLAAATAEEHFAPFFLAFSDVREREDAGRLVEL